MTRAETTKFLGKLLTDTRLGGAGSHWASEVSIDPWTPKARRVQIKYLKQVEKVVTKERRGAK